MDLTDLSFMQVDALKRDAERAERAALGRWIEACRVSPSDLVRAETLHREWCNACERCDMLDEEMDRRVLFYEDA